MGALVQAMKEGLALPPDYTVSEWADKHVFLSSEIAAEPGPFRTSRTPFAREMMDVQTDPSVEVITYKTSAQVAKTTTELNGIGYHIHHDPCPMLAVLPTDVVAETFSKGKLAPFIAGTPVLSERVPEGRAGKSTITLKEFPGGYLAIVGANTPAGLAMRSVRIVWADEIDRFPTSAGREGDPLMLAFKRSQTFVNRKLVVSSTPTIKGSSRIDDFFEQSDKRHFYVPMPCCGAHDKLVWENVKWRQGEPWTAEYMCASCGSLISDQQIKLAVRAPSAHWRAEAPFTGNAGFHIWQIYSPWSSLREIVTGYEETKGNAAQHEVWHNTTLGQSWDADEQAGISVEKLLNARKDFHPDIIPAGACLVCASVDVQKDWLEVLYVAYGPSRATWYLDHQIILGDPTGKAVWTRLEEALLRRYRQETHPHITRPIEGVAIDSGAFTQDVYEFCAKAHFAGRPWYAIKGQSGEGKLPWSMAKVTFKGGVRLHNIGIDALKSSIYARLASDDQTENNLYIRNAECFGEGFIGQLISERVRTVIDGKGFTKKEWFLPSGLRNEALDLAVYNEAVHRHLNINLAGRLEAMAVAKKKSLGDLARKLRGDDDTDGVPA